MKEPVIQHTDRKGSIIGIFEEIKSVDFPVRQPRFVIINRWIGGQGEFTMQIRLMKPNKDAVISETQPQKLNFLSPDQHHMHVFVLVNTPFETPGDYWIESLLEGKVVHTERLRLIQGTPE
jgi:hypothetical protein